MSASSVASLRSRTGVSISACKDALDEAGGDEEKAIALLRKRGVTQAAKKAEREQGEGKIFIAHTDAKAVLVMLKCETDFVSRGDAFIALGQDLADCLLSEGKDAASKKAENVLPEAVQKLGENITLSEDIHSIDASVVGSYVHTNGKIGVIIGLDGGSVDQAKDVAMHAAAMNPQVVSPDDISDDILAQEKDIWAEQLKKEGKPAEIMEKIMIGKEKKFREENALLKQNFVKDPDKTIEQYLGDAKITNYVRVAIG
jgi:elongation factor Ts